ncbi:GPW/gp25 family protein [Desulfobulbus elongatus]|uniref:GPW/gp25 family protein n=1 Tax=Desulfobulbus elongatus TaxID=53332 RepID=UPI00047F2872|nr:GPW/gp25 family protein [Desulfobulbus elongatus]
MIGMDSGTGKHLEGIAHLRQSVRDILTTPLGSRVMRRDYGSRLFRLIDAPLTPGLLVDLYAATAEALEKWEPRFQLIQAKAESVADSGRVVMILEGRYLPDGQPITLDGIVVQ